MIWSYQDTVSANFQYSVANAGQTQCPAPNRQYYYQEFLTGFAITDSTGALHTFGGLTTKYRVGINPTGSDCALPNSGLGPLQSNDGSGYSMIISSGQLTVYDRNGHYWLGQCSYEDGCYILPTFFDPDGNFITHTRSSSGGVMDSLGTTALSGVPDYTFLDDIPNISSPSFSYADANGNTQQYSFVYTTLNLASNFDCQSGGVQSPEDFGRAQPGIQRSMLSKIVLPGESSSQYVISYEATPNMPGYYTGRVASITLPSGGSISYIYSGGNNGINCNTGTVPTIAVTVSDNNGNTGTYTYASSLVGAVNNFGNYTVTRTDPQGNQVVYSFAGSQSNNSNTPLQTQAVYYQGAAGSTVLKTVTTCYNGASTNCATPSSAPQLPLAQIDEYTSYGPSTANALTEILYDTFGNVTSEKVIDYGNVGSNGQCSSATAGVCKLTTTTYGTWNGSACTSLAGIPSAPCDVRVSNANTGAVTSETRYTYNTAGHPTSISKWVSGSAWQTTTNVFNGNGTLASALTPPVRPLGNTIWTRKRDE